MTMFNAFRVRLYKITDYLFRLDSHKIADFLVWFVIAIAFSMVVYFTVDCLYPSKLIVFDYKVWPIAREFTHDESAMQTFKPGDFVPLRLTGHRYTDAIPTIVTHLVNAIDGSVVTSITTLKTRPEDTLIVARSGKGPFNFVSLSRTISKDCYSGTFYFDNTYVYRRNFIKDNEQYNIRSETFRVLVPKEAHDEAEDEALIRRILKTMKLKGDKGDPGKQGDPGKRGPNLFGK